MGYDEILEAIKFLSPEERDELDELRMKRGIVTAEEIVEAFKQLSPEERDKLLKAADKCGAAREWLLRILRQGDSACGTIDITARASDGSLRSNSDASRKE